MAHLLLVCAVDLLSLSFCHSCFLAEEMEVSAFFKVPAEIDTWLAIPSVHLRLILEPVPFLLLSCSLCIPRLIRKGSVCQ